MFFFSLKSFSCQPTICWMYCTMDSREMQQRIPKVNTNMKIQSLNYFLLKKIIEGWEYSQAVRGKWNIWKRENILAFPGQVNNLTEFQFHLLLFLKPSPSSPYCKAWRNLIWKTCKYYVSSQCYIPWFWVSHSYYPRCAPVLSNFLVLPVPTREVRI